MEEIGCKNESADIVVRKNDTWSDTNLKYEFNSDTPSFIRLICSCGSLNFEVLQVGDYETAAQCVKCKKYYLVHCG